MLSHVYKLERKFEAFAKFLEKHPLDIDGNIQRN